MPSYVVTGAARGLGYEFVQQLSRESSNIVFALVRNVEKATALNDLSSSRKNIHVLHCDVTQPADIEAAATAVGTATGGSLDVLIHNAYAADFETLASPPTAFTTEHAALAKKAIDVALGTAVYAVLWLTNAFLPLIRKGKDKKIIHLSSGIVDLPLVEKTGVTSGVPYAISKASTNILVAKFAAELREEGIWVLALSPGWVNTQNPDEPVPPEMMKFFQVMLGQFQKVKPDLTGPISPEDSVRMQLEVVGKLDGSMSGKFLSQHGDQNWF